MNLLSMEKRVRVVAALVEGINATCRMMGVRASDLIREGRHRTGQDNIKHLGQSL